VLTESTAQKFFGKEDPIGKTFHFTVDKEFDFTVGAIIKDLPPNTHLPATIFVSYSYSENFLRPNLDGWTYVSGTETLIVAPENSNLTNIKAQLTAIADKYINKDQGEPNFRSDFELQPLNEVHFNESYGGGGGWVPSISPSWLWFFAAIGLAVLILACINFMNLSTAQALTRAKEVGVRKSIGAGKVNLMLQFLSEAWILTFLSGIIAMAMAQLFLPSINTLVDKNITFDLLQSPQLLTVLLVSVTAIGLLAGIYPAWIIAKFNPTTTLKVGTMATGDHGTSWLRKGLVVVQFTISVGLLMVVILIGRQVDFLRSENLGFNKDNIINVEIKAKANREHVFRNELNKIAQVKDVSFATATPSSEGHWGTIMNRNNREDPTRKDVTLIFGDERFCKMYDLNLIAGRLLEASDTNYISRTLPEEKQMMKAVVNEKLIHELGFKSNEAALGEHIWIGWNSGHVEIVGVVADFNTGSLHETIKPALITAGPGDYEQAGIKIEAGSNVPHTIAAIETAWKTAYPEGVFTFKFLDEQIDAFYKAEERLFRLFEIFSGLAMFISCLGLWGLATFAAQSRTKEIGVRKVLGASINNIVALISRDFIILVITALLIATPLAWYGMNQWLLHYAYRTEITWWIFGIAGTSALAIALLTVSTQAIKAAMNNPVDSLRSE